MKPKSTEGMLKYFMIPAIFFILITRGSFAQYSPIDRCLLDSLYRIKPHETRVQKAEIYLELAKLCDTNQEKSFNYILLAFRISVLENNYAIRAISRLAMGNYYQNNRKYVQSQEYYLAALKIYQCIADTNGEMSVLAKIGILNRNLKNYDKALSFFQNGLELAQKTKSQSMKGKFHHLMASTYQQMNDWVKSMDLYLEAMSDLRKIGDKINELEVQDDFGTLLMDQKRYEEALDLFLQIINTSGPENGFEKGIHYTRIAHIYSQMKDYSMALQFDKKALKERQKVNATDAINSSFINIAGDYYKLGMPDSGKIFMDMGLNLAHQYNRRHLIENGYRQLYQYYLNTGDYEKALTNYDRYVRESEIIMQERNKSNISILEANQQIQRIQESEKLLLKENEIKTLNIGTQKYQFVFAQVITIGAGVFMIMFVSMFVFNRRIRRKMQEMNTMLSGEIIEREATERQTSERERQYRFLSENSGDFITQSDSRNKRIYASPASVRVYGYEPDEILHKSSYDLTHPDYYAYAEANFKEMIESRSSRQLIYKAIKKDGAHFWAESAINPLFDPNTGAFKGMVGVTRDIQERKDKEFEIIEGTRQKENLLQEIHHRVKNNFAILVSLINMQMGQSKNKRLLQSLTNLQLRIRTMALVHEMLYRSEDFENISFPDYLRSLASVIAGNFNRRDIMVTFEADDTVIDIEAAIPLGLIFNEILSNAYRHAFPNNRAGNIGITFKSDPEKRMNTLIVKDDGIGMPTDVSLDELKTMGLQVVRILCKQIEGALKVKNDAGASFIITFKSS
ncbi:MAG: histidine kinase dimerization/phosphoacceptor domain -containing protein [Bacteroidota bacterium]